MPQRKEPLCAYDLIRAIQSAECDLDESASTAIWIRREGTGQYDEPVQVKVMEAGILIITEPCWGQMDKPKLKLL